jgi:hypothetical protein
MACGAVVRKSGRNVTGVLSGVEIGDVTAKAIRGSAGKSSGHVTSYARQARMSADQRELRQGGVIEFGSLPAIRSMTGLALH